MALARIRAAAPLAGRLDIPAATLIAERATLMRLPLPGRVSAGGACRLLDCADGAIALNLPRPDDWDLLPAWLEAEPARSWEDVARIVAMRSAPELLARARLLGLAAARADLVPPPPVEAVPWRRLGSPRPGDAARAPVVLDLTALWAGPLASHLLERAGARVIKVESPQRVDGARHGHAGFYALLNQGKLCVTVDLATAQGRERLLALIARADIVLESSRPRALRQLGIDAEALVAGRPGLTWISITAHGRDGPAGDWVGYGDDAAAAAGLCAAVREATGSLAFIGDAIADPLTGIAAADEALRAWREGGGVMAALALSDTVARALHHDRNRFASRHSAMLAKVHRDGFPPAPRRAVTGPVGAIGAHDDWPLEALEALAPC